MGIGLELFKSFNIDSLNTNSDLEFSKINHKESEIGNMMIGGKKIKSSSLSVISRDLYLTCILS